jgi:hypothetical protein
LIIGAVAAVTGAARAERVVAPERIRLVYHAPAGCPDDDAFFAGIEARARVIRVDTAAERTFSVSIIEDARHVRRGSLRVTTAAGIATTQEVPGETCDEIATALELVAALAVEERIVAPASAAQDPERPSLPAAEPEPARRQWTLDGGVGVTRYSGITPDALFGGSVFGTMGWKHGPQLRIEVARTIRKEIVTSGESTDFQWTTGLFDACTPAMPLSLFDVTPCAGLQAGMLEAHGHQVMMPIGGARPWLAPEAAVRLRVRLHAVALELDAAAAAPLVRDRFFVAPSTTVYRVPAVVTGIGFSLVMNLL